ncbi:MAG: hypothetical protein U0791_02750 [Gemmataceae bacterium]
MKRVWAAVALMMSAGAVPAAPPPVEAPTTPERLVLQLGSDSFPEREAAAAALEKLGPAARSALDQAVRHANPEVSKRAIQLLTALHRKADAADRLTVKKVKLAYRNTPIGAAVNDLKARTGINLWLDPTRLADPLRTVTCETGDLPPWEAVAKFCEAAGLQEVFDAEVPVPKQERSRRHHYQPPPPPPKADFVPVSLADGSGKALPGSRNTAVRITALPDNFNKNRVYLGTGDVLLHFDIAPMPGYHWKSVAGVRVTKVVDEYNRIGSAGANREPDGFMGGALEVFGGGAVFLAGGIGWDGEPGPRPTAYPNPRITPVPIRVGTPNARTLKVLEGAVVCEIAVPDQPLITIDNVAGNLNRGAESLRGSKLTVLEANPGEKGGKAILKVQVDQPNPMMINGFPNPWGGLVVEESLPATAPNQVRGFNAAGKPVRLVTLTNSETSADEFTQSFTTQYTCPDGLPVRVVLYGPKPVLVEVPFKMENVPLP